MKDVHSYKKKIIMGEGANLECWLWEGVKIILWKEGSQLMPPRLLYIGEGGIY